MIHIQYIQIIYIKTYSKIVNSFSKSFLFKPHATTVVFWPLAKELAGRRPVKVPSSSVLAQGYTVVKELGRGGQGTMYLCTKRSWFRTCLAEDLHRQSYDICLRYMRQC